MVERLPKATALEACQSELRTFLGTITPGTPQQNALTTFIEFNELSIKDNRTEEEEATRQFLRKEIFSDKELWRQVYSRLNTFMFDFTDIDLSVQKSQDTKQKHLIAEKSALNRIYKEAVEKRLIIPTPTAFAAD